MKKVRVFNGKVIGSIVGFSIICAFCLVWLVSVVIIPLFTTPIVFTLPGIFSFLFDLLIMGLILFAIVHNSLDLITYAPRAALKSTAAKSAVKIKRLDLNQRIQHIYLIVTTVFLALSGFALMFYQNWGKDVVNFFGGFSQTLDVHYAAAIALGALVLYHFGYYASKYLTNKAMHKPAPLDINFTLKDIKDLLANLKYYLGMGPAPKYNKYNYAQRFDYWGIYWGMLILGVPGVLLWAYGFNAYGGLAFVFHTKEALLAVLFLAVFHFYQAHFSPRHFPMDAVYLTGSISEEDMAEEHPLQFEKLRTP